MLMESGVAWTMLRNSAYMDGVPRRAATMIAEGRAVVSPGEIPTAYVTRADCAAAAAAVLTTPGHENRIYDITGPAAVGAREIATAASTVSGRQIEIVEDSGAGGGFGSGGLATVSTDVADLTGRPATSVLELLRRNAASLGLN